MRYVRSNSTCAYYGAIGFDGTSESVGAPVCKGSAWHEAVKQCDAIYETVQFFRLGRTYYFYPYHQLRVYILYTCIFC